MWPQIELEFASVGFCIERKTEEPRENPRSKDENQQQTQPRYDAWGLFLESPGNFSDPKPKFEIKTRRVVAQVLAHKPMHFVSLTDSSIVLLSKLINLRPWMQTEQPQNSFTGPKSYRDFWETASWGPFLESPGYFTGP